MSNAAIIRLRRKDDKHFAVSTLPECRLAVRIIRGRLNIDSGYDETLANYVLQHTRGEPLLSVSDITVLVRDYLANVGAGPNAA